MPRGKTGEHAIPVNGSDLPEVEMFEEENVVPRVRKRRLDGPTWRALFLLLATVVATGALITVYLVDKEAAHQTELRSQETKRLDDLRDAKDEADKAVHEALGSRMTQVETVTTHVSNDIEQLKEGSRRYWEHQGAHEAAAALKPETSKASGK